MLERVTFYLVTCRQVAIFSPSNCFTVYFNVTVSTQNDFSKFIVGITGTRPRRAIADEANGKSGHSHCWRFVRHVLTIARPGPLPDTRQLQKNKDESQNSWKSPKSKLWALFCSGEGKQSFELGIQIDCFQTRLLFVFGTNAKCFVPGQAQKYSVKSLCGEEL